MLEMLPKFLQINKIHLGYDCTMCSGEGILDELQEGE